MSLERLVQDGRIHPARIEEVYAATTKEMEEELAKIGKEAVQEANFPNIPKPIKGRQGFYQCVAAAGLQGRRSYDSLDSLSTWDSEEEKQTAPTTWSPGSTPIAKQDEPLPQPPLERSATFGKIDQPRVRTSVGVAM